MVPLPSSQKVHIELNPGTKPIYHCAYPIPHKHCKTFTKGHDHLVKLCVLEPHGASEWATPALLFQNRWQITDLWSLNGANVHKQTSYQSSW